MGSLFSVQPELLLASPARCETNGKMVTAKMDWTIKNFGFKCMTYEAGSLLKSTSFYAVENKTIQWELRLFPFGLKDNKKGSKEGNVSLYLALVPDIPTTPDDIAVEVSFSLFDYTNSVKELLVEREFTHVYKSTVSVIRGLESCGFIDVIERLKVCETESLIISCKVNYEINEKHPIPIITSKLTSPIGSSLPEHIEQLFKTMHNSDVCFRVQGKKMQAHKFMLISRSPVFTAMFDHQMKENQTRVVDIVDINPDTFRSILYFIYTDKVKLETEEEAKKLLFAADKYMLELLKHKCEEFLSSCVRSSNFLELLALAYVHTALHLKKAALEFIHQEINRDERKTMTEIANFTSSTD